MRDFGLCRICFRELANKGEIPGLKNQVGNKFMDPISDMLTRIRNASAVNKET